MQVQSTRRPTGAAEHLPGHGGAAPCACPATRPRRETGGVPARLDETRSRALPRFGLPMAPIISREPPRAPAPPPYAARTRHRWRPPFTMAAASVPPLHTRAKTQTVLGKRVPLPPTTDRRQPHRPRHRREPRNHGLPDVGRYFFFFTTPPARFPSRGLCPRVGPATAGRCSCCICG